MKFKEWFLIEDFALEREIPPEPGTTPIPSDHIRLYHYTKIDAPNDLSRFQAAESLRRHGIDIRKAIGSTYGEPNVVWASTQMPSRSKVFAEFSVAKDDRRWAVGRPDPADDPSEYMAKGGDSFFMDSIRPEEIIAVHEPWHFHYRYILDNPQLKQEVIEGEHDHLLNTDKYGPAIRRVKAERK